MSSFRGRHSLRQSLPRFHNLNPSWTKDDIPAGFEWFGERIGFLHAGMLGEILPRDLMGTGADAVQATASALPTLQSGTVGRPLRFDGGDDHYTIADNAALTFPAASEGGWTFAFLIENSTTTTQYDYFFSWGNYQATPSFNLIVESSSKLFLEYWASGSAYNRVGSNANICPLTDLSLVVLVCKPNIPTPNLDENISIWINGANVTNINISTGQVGELNVASAFYHMRRNAASGQNPDGDVYWFGRWDYPWSEGQMRQLADNPVAPFQTHRPHLFVPGAIPSGVEVIVPSTNFTFAKYTPGVATGAQNTTPLASYTFTSYTPSVETGVNIDVPVTNFTFTKYAPTIGSGIFITVGLINYTFTKYSPNISIGTALDVPITNYTFVEYTPIVTTGIDIIVGTINFTLTGYIPSIFTNVEVGITNYNLTTYTPEVAAGKSVAVSLKNYTFTGYVPSVSAVDAEITIPDVKNYTLTGYAPVVENGIVFEGCPFVRAGYTTYLNVSSTTPHTINYPSLIEAGDYLVSVVGVNRLDTVSWDGSWTAWTASNNASDADAAIAYKIADGTETGTYDITLVGNGLISNHTFALADVDRPPEKSAWTFGSTATTPSDPPSLTPAAGLSTYLWHAVSMIDHGRFLNSHPANMTEGPEIFSQGANFGSPSTASDFHCSEASSFDPDAFQWGASGMDASITIAWHGGTYTLNHDITTTKSYTLTGYAPELNTVDIVIPTTKNYTFTKYLPGISTIVPPILDWPYHHFTFTGYAPTQEGGTMIDVPYTHFTFRALCPWYNQWGNCRDLSVQEVWTKIVSWIEQCP